MQSSMVEIQKAWAVRHFQLIALRVCGLAEGWKGKAFVPRQVRKARLQQRMSQVQIWLTNVKHQVIQSSPVFAKWERRAMKCHLPVKV